MADQATAIEQPQTSFEEADLDDDALLVALNEWATADAEVDRLKEGAAPINKAVADAKEARAEAGAAVNHRLSQMEIEIVGTENVYRCGTYRLENKHREESPREFVVEAKDELKIEHSG